MELKSAGEKGIKVTKEDAIDILDRTIGFISNCDNKAAIVLGVFGVMMTFIVTNEGIADLERIILAALLLDGPGIGMYLLLLFLSVAVFVIGMIMLVAVLFAKLDCSGFEREGLDTDSKIYFGDIAKNTSYQKYKEKLLNANEDMLVNDIISQIYVNSKICRMKFEKYNYGIRIAIVGFFAFLLFWLLGRVIFIGG